MEVSIEQLLKTRVPDDLFGMQDLARELDAYRYEVYARVVETAKHLTEEKNRYQMIKGPKTTEADRKFYTEFHTRDAQEAADMAYGTYKMINDKINLIQTLSKAENEVYKRNS